MLYSQEIHSSTLLFPKFFRLGLHLTVDNLSSSFRSSALVACSANTDSSFVEGGDVISKYDVSIRRNEVAKGILVVSTHLLTERNFFF